EEIAAQDLGDLIVASQAGERPGNDRSVGGDEGGELGGYRLTSRVVCDPRRCCRRRPHKGNRDSSKTGCGRSRDSGRARLAAGQLATLADRWKETSVAQRAKPRRWYSRSAAVLVSSTYSITWLNPLPRRCARPASVSAVPRPMPWAAGSTPSTYTSPIGSCWCSPWACASSGVAGRRRLPCTFVQWNPSSAPSAIRSASRNPSGSNQSSAIRVLKSAIVHRDRKSTRLNSSHVKI